MTNETKTPLQADSEEQIIVALAHLSMIAQAANGEYRPRPGEIEQRQAWLISFIRTGQGIVNEADRELAQGINAWLSAQHRPLSAQHLPLSAESDAA